MVYFRTQRELNQFGQFFEVWTSEARSRVPASDSCEAHFVQTTTWVGAHCNIVEPLFTDLVNERVQETQWFLTGRKAYAVQLGENASGSWASSGRPRYPVELSARHDAVRRFRATERGNVGVPSSSVVPQTLLWKTSLGLESRDGACLVGWNREVVREAATTGAPYFFFANAGTVEVGPANDSAVWAASWEVRLEALFEEAAPRATAYALVARGK